MKTIADVLAAKLYAVGAREYLEAIGRDQEVAAWLPTARHAPTMVDVMLLVREDLTWQTMRVLQPVCSGTPAALPMIAVMLPDVGATHEEMRCAIVEAVEHLVIDGLEDLESAQQIVKADRRQLDICRILAHIWAGDPVAVNVPAQEPAQVAA